MAAARYLTKAKQAVLLTLDAYGTPDKVSTFQKTGKITPEEFVRAGDFLVENFRSWEWMPGLPDKRRPHLPEGKQFLQTRNVPTYPRTREDAPIDERNVEDDWVEAGLHSSDEPEAEMATLTLESEKKPAAAAAAAATAEDDDDDDEDFDPDEIEDLDSFDYNTSAVADDDDTAVAAPAPAAAAASGDGEAEASVYATRTYDITITYDVHYSTPRLWLFGYDADRQPLKKDMWREDFSKEHVDKTVTYETHPHLGFSCPSIHPCKHAQAMQRLIALTVSGHEGAQLDVNYMLIFLKFIQSIIPNIEYDYTGDFQIETTGEEADDGGK